MNKVPPVASVAATGPLGVVQLPRLWSKVLLDTKGLLPEGYFPCGDGFDKIALDGLGLDREEVVGYLTSELPSYPEFEKWILAKKGGSIPQDAIEKVNSRILGAIYPEEKRAASLSAMGMDPATSAHEYTRMLMYDDWHEFHRCLTKGQ